MVTHSPQEGNFLCIHVLLQYNVITHYTVHKYRGISYKNAIYSGRNSRYTNIHKFLFIYFTGGVQHGEFRLGMYTLLTMIFSHERGCMYTLLTMIFSHAYITKALQNGSCLHLDYTRSENESVNNQCSKIHVCNKTFTISYIQVPPYHTIFSINNDILKRCCGNCTPVSKEYEIRHLHNSEGLFNRMSINSSDFIFPVLEKSTATRSHGYFFIPVVRLPSMIYVTAIRQSVFERAVISCINLYPLLTICLLMSLISGFIVWMMETRVNTEEFPRSFPTGWVKGIWWSVVTMASTGLESTPRSLLARILSVIWIVTGVIMLGLLTSSITAAMIKPTPIPKMDGAKVGTLKHRPYNDFMITKHGGRVRTYSASDVYSEFYELAKSFYLGEIDGILMDKYTLSYATKYISNMSRRMRQNKIPKYFTTNTVLTEKNDDESMSFGILVKDGEVYKYFENSIRDNWLYYEKMFSMYVNNISEDEQRRRLFIKDFTAPLFSPSDPFVYYAMAGFAVTLLLICVFGMLYELSRRESSARKLCSNGGTRLEECQLGLVSPQEGKL
jgi:hypothetical protein